MVKIGSGLDPQPEKKPEKVVMAIKNEVYCIVQIDNDFPEGVWIYATFADMKLKLLDLSIAEFKRTTENMNYPLNIQKIYRSYLEKVTNLKETEITDNPLYIQCYSVWRRAIQ